VTNPKSSVIYRGPSLIDGEPIVAVAIVKSGNIKTGNMVQTYILRADIDPRAANKSGSDFSICGNCKHRGKAHDDPDKPTAKERTCYVQLGQGPLGVWKMLSKGGYPTATGHDEIAALGKGRMVRLGTYGDPAAVPSHIWDSLLHGASGHTAYTHQSGMKGPDISSRYMISADSLEDARKAWKRGSRTFRVVSDISEIDSAEILCPASQEAGRRTTCERCKLCSGSTINAKSIAIPVHGAGATHYVQ
tara:strand:- start:12 stop:752 length:741 start_codon:yes stop_codon:yes gene_type:complete